MMAYLPRDNQYDCTERVSAYDAASQCAYESTYTIIAFMSMSRCGGVS